MSIKEWLRKERKKFKKSWNEYRKFEVIKTCGFDPYTIASENAKLKEKISDLEEENTALKDEIYRWMAEHDIAEKSHLEAQNKLMKEQISKFQMMHNDFPVMLRKMWSGSEVVSWIKEKQNEYLNSSKKD